ncbi:MAG: NAD(P)/FAD-dependent oxidoreductase [Alphaproteobacteria bacterium]|nr:NAD(P)/FAD-dependent oxidoreductase [Alphaproteobacteria bacterium]
MGAKTYDAIIVGGGHNGLVAAGYLARAGLKVVVLERRGVVGGPCGPVEYFPGYWGAITNSPGSLEPKIVQDLELERFGLQFVRPDPSMVMPFPSGRCFVAWRDKAKVVAKIREFSTHDVASYYKLFDDLQAFANKLKSSLFESPPSLTQLMSRMETPEDEEAFAKIMFGSIKDMLDERLESEELKAVVAMLAVMHNQAGPSTPGTPYMLLQRPLSLASVSVSAENDPRLQPMRGSTGLPIGGMGAIPRAMARSLESKGGTIRTNAGVAEIITGTSGVEGVVLTSGERIAGRIVLSNLNPRTTLLDLVQSSALPAEFTRRVQALNMRGSAFKVALALDDLPRFAVARNDEEVRQFAGCQFRIAPSMDYLERAYDDCKYGRWSEGPVFWGLTPSVTDPGLAPPGKHVMSINIFHAPYRLAQGDWSAECDRFGQHCIDMLVPYIPNLKRIVSRVRFWSPQDLENEYGLIEGNISHGDMVPGRMFAMRPLPGWAEYRTPIKGLYLCGSGVWPGGLVSGLPGHNASHQAIRDLKAGLDSIPVWRRHEEALELARVGGQGAP